MSDRPPSDIEGLLRRLYAAFNSKDVEVVLAALHEDVDWPNVSEGVRLHGREAVRAYWSRQFATIDPRVEPESVASSPTDAWLCMCIRWPAAWTARSWTTG